MTRQPTFSDVTRGSRVGMFPECYQEGLDTSAKGGVFNNPYFESGDMWQRDRAVSYSNGWYDGLDKLTDNEFTELLARTTA